MNKYIKWLLTGLSVALCVFIWHFSFADAAASTQTSNSVLDTCNEMLASAGSSVRLTSFFVRKTAHFTEFFALGILAGATVRSYGVRYFAPGAVAIPFLSAIVDESIQVFSPGRVASIRDVLLDSVGGCCGVLLFLLLYLIFQKRTRKTDKKT